MQQYALVIIVSFPLKRFAALFDHGFLLGNKPVFEELGPGHPSFRFHSPGSTANLLEILIFEQLQGAVRADLVHKQVEPD